MRNWTRVSLPISSSRFSLERVPPNPPPAISPFSPFEPEKALPVTDSATVMPEEHRPAQRPSRLIYQESLSSFQRALTRGGVPQVFSESEPPRPRARLMSPLLPGCACAENSIPQDARQAHRELGFTPALLLQAPQ